MEPLTEDTSKQLLELIILVRNDESISNKFRIIDDILKYDAFVLLKTEVDHEFVAEFNATINKTFQRNEEIVKISGQHLSPDAKVLIRSHFKLLGSSLSLFKEQFSLLLSRVHFDRFLLLQVLICKLILSVYGQCKHWKSLYSPYATNFSELLNIFKVTQDVQMDCLVLLENRINLSTVNTCNHDSFLQLCDILCDTADLLFAINTKSMLSTWRCYLSLIKLNTRLEAVKPIRILFRGIIGCFQKEDDELNFKIISFLFRIIKCIFTLTSEQENPHLCEFFEQICNLCELAGNGYELFWTDVNEFLSKLVIQDKLFTTEMRSCNSIGLTKATKMFLLKSNINMHIGRTQAFINSFLHNFSKDSYDYLRNSDQYENILTDFIAVILGVDSSEYLIIEEYLLNYILQGNSWQVTFAYDVWILILSMVSPQMAMETMRSLLKKVPKNTVFKNNMCYMFTQSILSNCYSALPKYMQNQFLDALLSRNEINTISLCGIKILPSEKESFSLDIADRLNKFNDEHPTHFTDFLYLMDGIAVLSRLLIPGDNSETVRISKDLLLEVQSKLSELVTKFWRINERTLNCNLYVGFLTNALFPLLLVLIRNMQINNAQLLKILHELKRLSQHSFCQLLGAVIVEELVSLSPDELNLFVHQIVLEFVEAWKSPIESPIVQHYVDAARARFEANTAWLKIKRNVRPRLQKDDVSSMAKKCKFQTETSINATASTVADESSCNEAQDILDHMKDELKLLKKLATNGKWAKVTKKNSQDIFLIADTLKQFV